MASYGELFRRWETRGILQGGRPLHKAGFNEDEPRDAHGRWTGGNNTPTVTTSSKSAIIIHHPDGSQESRTGGSRAWRNNNPGNIVSGTFADAHGAIGGAGGFAVFPDEATGQAASGALLRTPAYSQLTIDQAIARRSPSTENDTETLQNSINGMGGFSGNERISDLTPEQLSRLVSAIKRTEGWIPGTITRNPPR